MSLAYFSSFRGNNYYVSATREGKVYRWQKGERHQVPLKPPIPHMLVTTIALCRETLALGMHSGHVIVLDIISHSQSNLESSKISINSLCFSYDAKILFAANEEGQVHEYRRQDNFGEMWSVQPSRLFVDGVGSVTCMVCMKNQLVLAVKNGTRLKALDINTGAKLAKWPKCPAPPISHIAILDKTGDLVLVAYQHRQMTVFGPNAQELSVSGPGKPLLVVRNPYRKEKHSNHILTVTDLGRVNIWNLQIHNESDGFITPVGEISVSEYSITDANFTSETTIILVYGPKIAPAFEIVTYIDSSGIIPNINIISKIKTGSVLLQNTPKTKQKSSINTTILGLTDMKLPSVTAVLPKSTVPTTDPDVESISFGERLKPTLPDQPRLESMDTVLLQALKTQDLTLMNTVLNNRNEEIIHKTIEKLPQSAVLPFLSFVIKQFYNDAQVVRWVRLVLIYHTPHLLTVPDLSTQISQLYAMIESRLGVFGDLVRLQGRMNLLLDKIEITEEGGTKMSTKALNVYKEVEEDEEVEKDNNKEEDEVASEHEEGEFYKDFYKAEKDWESKNEMRKRRREEIYLKDQMWGESGESEDEKMSD